MLQKLFKFHLKGKALGEIKRNKKQEENLAKSMFLNWKLHLRLIYQRNGSIKVSNETCNRIILILEQTICVQWWIKTSESNQLSMLSQESYRTAHPSPSSLFLIINSHLIPQVDSKLPYKNQNNLQELIFNNKTLSLQIKSHNLRKIYNQKIKPLAERIVFIKIYKKHHQFVHLLLQGLKFIR